MFYQASPGLLCGLAALLVATSGCTSLTGGDKGQWNWKKPFSRSEPKDEESLYEQPVRLAAIWTPDVLTMPGKPPTRGFGGRIYFYNNRSETIPVDGQLAVYGFDDTDPDLADTIPQKRYVFTREQFTQHFSATELGASYSIWIPWDNGESSHKVVSLLPVFTSASGHRVPGAQSRNALAGRKPNHRKRNSSKGSPETLTEHAVQPASFDASQPIASPMWGPVTPEERQRASRRTTTIEMPASMAARNAWSTNAPNSAAEQASIATNLEVFNNFQRQTTLSNQQPPYAAFGPSQGRYPGPQASSGFHTRVTEPEGRSARFESRELRAPALSNGRPTRDHAAWPRHPAEQPPSHPY
jgi:hypothetical protein